MSKKAIEMLLKETDITINGSMPWDPQVHNHLFYQRILSEGSLGLGESYMEGWWDCKDLDTFFYKLFGARIEDKIKGNLKLTLEVLKTRIFNLQSRAKAKNAIHYHYDLGNDLFQRMLDPLMMYSCAYWEGVANLKEAQEQKLKLICEKLKLTAGETVLDIGCGWGGFAYYAAENYGVKVIGVTISKEQKTYAEALCTDLDVEIQLQDYRDVEGQFDKIVSIGMFEHVGHKNHRVFMKMVNKLLRDEGIALLHFISSNETTITTDPWINNYIFPNGLIPSLTQVGQASDDLFVIEDLQNLGLHYDPTLLQWQSSFKKNWKYLQKDYDYTFFRMWNYYLSCCAASFRARRLNLWQIVMLKPQYPHDYKPVRTIHKSHLQLI